MCNLQRQPSEPPDAHPHGAMILNAMRAVAITLARGALWPLPLPLLPVAGRLCLSTNVGLGLPSPVQSSHTVRKSSRC